MTRGLRITTKSEKDEEHHGQGEGMKKQPLLVNKERHSTNVRK